MVSGTVKRGFVLASILSLSLGSVSLAATSEINVRSQFSAQDVFVVVYNSEKGTSDLKPGVYVLSRGRDNPQLLLPGQVLGAGRGFNGVLDQFSLTAYSQRNEALAVINGKLTIFCTKTRNTRPDSFITIGSGRAPLKDVMNRREVDLAPITDINDVNVLTTEAQGEYQRFLISVRQPSPFASEGITFAALLRRPTSSESQTAMELWGPPVVIDYDFYTVQELQQLVQTSTYDGVLSPAHLLHYKEAHHDDDRILKTWREKIAKLLRNVKTERKIIKPTKDGKDAKDATAEETIPYYSLIDGRVVFDNLPYMRLLSAPLTVIQRMNPSGGDGSGIIVREASHPQVNIDEELSPTTPPTAPGRVDYDEAKGAYRLYPINANNGAAVLAVVDGRPNIFLTTSQGNVAKIDVSTIVQSNFRQFASYLVSVNEPDRETHLKHYVFISRGARETGYATDVLVLDERDGIVKHDRLVNLNRRLLSDKELANRVYVADLAKEIKSQKDGREGHEVLYDDVTGVEKVLSARHRAADLKTPFVNITRTQNPNNWTQSYLNALETFSLIDRQLSYKKFEPSGAKKIQTGFYIYPTEDNPRDPEPHFLPGDLLSPVKDRANGPRELDGRHLKEVALKDKTKTNPMYVAAYAYNPEPGKKLENKFSLLVYLGPDGGASMSSGFFSVDIPTSIDRVIGAKFIQGRRQRGLNLTLLIFVKPAATKDPKPSERGGVYAINFDVNPREGYVDRSSRITSVKANWLERDNVRPDEIKYRLVWDTQGDLYWILTPEKERHDRNFKVLKPSILEAANSTIAPNQPGQRLLLRHNEPADDDDYENLFLSHSRWLVYLRQDIEERFSWFKQYMAEVEKAETSKRKDVQLFPQFEHFLEDRAKGGTNDHEVLLVEDQHKLTFLKTMMRSMVQGENGHWSLKNPHFRLFVFDPKVNDKEMREELDKIARHGDGRNLLVADLGEMLQVQSVPVDKIKPLHPVEDEPADGAEETDDNNAAQNEHQNDTAQEEEGTEHEAAEPEDEDIHADDVSFHTSMTMVMAAEGDRIPLRHFKSRATVGNKIPMLILATPAEWRAARAHYYDEDKAGVFSSFKVNAQFLTSSWSVWGPNTGKATQEVANAARAPISPDEYHVFPNLEKLLFDAAGSGQPADHRLIVVPDELKGLVRRLVLARWASDSKSIQGPWSFTNPALNLFQVNGEALSQELIADNFEAMRGALPGRRPVLMGDMSDILKIGRPRSSMGENAGFILKDPAISKNTTASGLSGETEEANNVTGKQLPHLMWWLATEGRRVQPKRAKSWKIEDDAKPEIPMLLFASENELAQLEQDAEFEGRFAKFTDHFKVERLQVPTEETRRKLINELFNRREIASLNYEFVHKGLPQDEARRQLVGVMVNRVEHIARNFNQEPTSAFLKAYLELRRTLTEDTRLRQERKIDSFFLERLYRRVFPMPLSFEILTADDPLRKLQDPDRAAIGLQERGYEGSTELKKKVIDTVTAQTKGADEGRPIPSSTILLGSTSTGKTFLFKTLINYMGLKVYDFAKPQDDTVSAFIVNAGTLVETEDPANPGRLSVDKAIRHLENFLSQPNGLRGFVLFDDLHKGSAAIRQKLLQFIQGFFEAPGGMMRVRRMNEKGDVFEIPVRNLNLFVTVNPQGDREIRKRYLGEFETSTEKEVIAALAGEGVVIDESFVARWSTLLNMDSFPREAKLPSLVTRIRQGAQQEFSSNPRLMLVTPPVLSEFVGHYPEANAREFLSAASYGMLSLDDDIKGSPLYVVLSRLQAEPPSGGKADGVGGQRRRTDKVNSSEIKEFLKRITVVRPVRINDIGSHLHLTSYMLDNFRTQLYHALITASQRMPEMSGTRQLRTRDMAAFLLGTVDNLDRFHSVPLDQVRLRPGEFVTNPQPNQVIEFNESIRKSSVGSDRFFRFNFQSERGEGEVNLDQFLGRTTYQAKRRGRLDVMSETAGDIEVILRELMASYFRVKDLDGSFNPDEWVAELSDREPKPAFKKASEAIVRLYFQFGARLFDPELREMAAESGFGEIHLTDYDRVRLFMMCVDKAVTQLPWGRMTRLMLEVVEHSVKDLSFGLKPPLQHLFFTSTLSPFSTLTPELVMELASTSADYRDFKTRAGEGLRNNFEANCDQLLISKDSDK